MKPVLQEQLERAVDELEAHDRGTETILSSDRVLVARDWEERNNGREALAQAVVGAARMLRAAWRLREERETGAAT